MKKLSMCVAVLAATTGISHAADVIMEAPAPMVAPMPVAERWAGFYAGVHAGYATGDADFDSAAPAPDGSISFDGFIGGVQAGYNWQFNNLVFGVEGVLSYSDVEGSETLAVGPGSITSTTSTEWAGLARLRAGYALDSILIYGTGGFAFARAEGGAIPTGLGGGPEFVTETLTGWTAGAGVEAFVTETVSLRGEWTYTDYGSEDFVYDGGTSVVDADAHAFTVGLNFHF